MVNVHHLHERIRGDERAEFVQRLVFEYVVGKSSIRALAAEHGWSYGSINNLLREGGVTFRPRGGNKRRPKQQEAA